MEIINFIKNLFKSLDFWKIILATLTIIGIVALIIWGIHYVIVMPSVKEWYMQPITNMKIWELLLILFIICRVGNSK